MLNKPADTSDDWGTPLNENFNTIEDKMLYRAIATYDSAQAAHVLQLQNIPLQHQAGLPQGLPDTFTVSVRFLEAYTEGDIIRVGAVDFVPKYAGFEAGDVLAVIFNQPEEICFFSSGGTGKQSIITADDVTYTNADMPGVSKVRGALDELAARPSGGNVETALQIANRLYSGVDLRVKFAAEIAAETLDESPWTWIKARIQAGNFEGINVGDYIPFIAGSNDMKAEIAGINTYAQYGDTAIGNHIDFISRDCLPDTHVFNKVNYNNGTSVSPYPFLASDLYAYLNGLQMSVPNATTANPALVAVDYRTTGIYSKLPASLQAVIVPKRLLLPQRYTAGSLLTADNSWGWVDAGKLWIPSEIEVYGCEHWGSKNGYSSGGFQQYPIFATNMKRIKGVGDGGSRSFWWLLSANGGNSTNFADVNGNGDANNNGASNTSIRVPVCFRIA